MDVGGWIKNGSIAKLTVCLLALMMLCSAAGCSGTVAEIASPAASHAPPTLLPTIEAATPAAAPTAAAELTTATPEPVSALSAAEPTVSPAPTENAANEAFVYANVPVYSGAPYTVINDNVPFFEQNEITDVSTERYSTFDDLGRCRTAWASVGLDLMPQGERGDISSVTPTGWNQAQVDGDWLYNRCHLIGYQLTAEDARPQNLITGTRYLNIQGMLPFENMVADYVKETGNHVMYRVTPVFEDAELVCRGVLMEAFSVEDGGDGVSFCVFAYNVQPGVELNYKDGSIISSTLPISDPAQEAAAQPAAAATSELAPAPADPTPTPEPAALPVTASYIGNKNTGKFHRSGCSSVGDMKESNKVALSSPEEAEALGYVACKRCKP